MLTVSLEKGKNMDMENTIKETKNFIVALDEILQLMKGSERKSRERSLAVTKLQEAIMWLGVEVKKSLDWTSTLR